MSPDPSRLSRCRNRFLPGRAKQTPVDPAGRAVVVVGVLFLLVCSAGQAFAAKVNPSGNDTGGGAARTRVDARAGATRATTSGNPAPSAFAQLQGGESPRPQARPATTRPAGEALGEAGDAPATAPDPQPALDELPPAPGPAQRGAPEPPAGANAPGGPATRTGPLIAKGVNASGGIDLPVNRSTVVSTSRPYTRVSVAQPDVADVNPLSPTDILVTGKKPGQTQVTVWDNQDVPEVIDVDVSFDSGRLQKEMKRLFPKSDLEFTELNGSLVLRGRVPSLKVAEQVAEMAGSFGKVMNQLEVAGGQQVMLQVRVAEVSRSATSALGVNFGTTDGTSFFGNNIGQVSPLGIVGDAVGGVDLGVTTPTPAVTLFGKGEFHQSAFAYFISALRQNNLVRILAEPNLVASSGEPASFLAGGEFPIPVTQGGGSGDNVAITIEYREFGVRLEFMAVTLGDGQIRLRCSPEVSELDFGNAVRLSGFVVPGLTQRKMSTTVELASGQTLAIAGLLNQSVTANKDVTPILGDLPILGTLFRSVRYQRRETELVVFVTPVLVGPMDPDQVAALPGEIWRHPSENDLFFGQDLGEPVEPARQQDPRAARRRPPLFYGPFGYTSSSATATTGGNTTRGSARGR